jgi:hypothetical protein
VSAAPFDTKVIQQRLRDKVPALRSVQGAADYAAITSLRDFAPPCAYVVLAGEKGTPTEPGYAPRGQVAQVDQMVQVAFGVVLVVRNYREQRGAQLADELSQMLAATRGALMGYVPDIAGSRACQFVQGDMHDYDASTALWVDVFQTQHSIGSQA